MNTITINKKEKKESCKYVVNIYKEDPLMPMQPLENTLCGVIEALL